jgi:hypothetical protein
MSKLPDGFRPLPDEREWYWKAIYSVATFLDTLVSEWPWLARHLTYFVNSRFVHPYAATAEVLADPLSRSTLLSKSSEEDFEEVERPTAASHQSALDSPKS